MLSLHRKGVKKGESAPNHLLLVTMKPPLDSRTLTEVCLLPKPHKVKHSGILKNACRLTSC